MIWRIISIESDGKIKIVNMNEGTYEFDHSGNRTGFNGEQPCSGDSFCSSQATTYACSAWSNVNPLDGDPIKCGMKSTLNTYLNGTYYNSKLTLYSDYIATGVPVYNAPGGAQTSETVTIPSQGDVTNASSSGNMSNNWLINALSGSTAWLIDPANGGQGAGYKLSVASDGWHNKILGSSNSEKYLPVIFLKEDVKITGGNGTSSSPYIVGDIDYCIKPEYCDLTLSETSGRVAFGNSISFNISHNCSSIESLVASSSDTSIATASVNGTTITVTGVSTVGTATITVKAKSITNSETIATYTIDVYDPNSCTISISGYSQGDTISLSSYSSVTLITTTSCSNITVTSSDPTIFTASYSSLNKRITLTRRKSGKTGTLTVTGTDTGKTIQKYNVTT